MRVLVGDAVTTETRHDDRAQAEFAFAESTVRAEHASRADGASRRVELLYGDVLLDVALVGPLHTQKDP